MHTETQAPLHLVKGPDNVHSPAAPSSNVAIANRLLRLDPELVLVISHGADDSSIHRTTKHGDVSRVSALTVIAHQMYGRLPPVASPDFQVRWLSYRCVVVSQHGFRVAATIPSGSPKAKSLMRGLRRALDRVAAENKDRQA